MEGLIALGSINWKNAVQEVMTERCRVYEADVERRRKEVEENNVGWRDLDDRCQPLDSAGDEGEK